MYIKNETQILRDCFGYESFREGQQEVIQSILRGQDTLVAMRTGGGKSLCYQVPALCMPGMAIVVSPLIALMKDQVDELLRKGVNAGALNSSMSSSANNQTMAAAMKGDIKILYVAPERFDSPSFIDAMCKIDVSFVAIDEAHCISVWGHDFRLAYKRLPTSLDKLDKARGRRLARVPLTATATPSVRDDIETQLQLTNPNTFMLGYSRDNLSLNVVRVGAEDDKDSLLIQQLEKIPEHEPTIIYSATVKSIGIIQKLLRDAGRQVTTYHGRLSPQERRINQDDFIGGKVNTIVATNAFGMGIDKSDIRHVIHYGMPASLENYYQEVGRGGRDGQPATGTLLFERQKDRNLQTFFIDTNHPDPLSVQSFYNKVRRLGVGRHEVNERNLIRGVDKAKDYQAEALLRRLEHVGMVEFQQVSGSRCWQIDVKATEAPLELKTLTVQRRNAIANLKAMEDYCLSKGCRKHAVLVHFGEINPARNCGNCDSCKEQGIKPAALKSKPQPTVASTQSPDKTTQSTRGESKLTRRKAAQVHVIELINAVNFHISVRHVSDTLIGATEDYLVNDKLDQLPQFGIMKDQGVIAVHDAISNCIQSGLLVSKNTNGVDRVSLTRKGWSIAKALKTSKLKNQAHLGEQQKGKQAEHLLTSLVALRLRIAKDAGTNPIVVATDSALEKIARYQPQTKRLLASAGLTHPQIERYGDRFLHCITKHKNVTTHTPTP